MEPFPTTSDLNADPDTMGEGHLWILEGVEGQPLRFSLRADGRLVFETEHRRIDRDSADPAVRPAIGAVQSTFRRDAFRDAVEDVTTVTFYGVATCQHRIEYDWASLPAFVGTDIYSAATDGLLAPERAHASFDRLGLTPAPAIDREVRADTIRPDRFTFPASKWADEPVAGVRLADKHGWRGRLDNPDRPKAPTASFRDADAAAAALLNDDLIDRIGTDDPVDDAVRALARERRATLEAAGIAPQSDAFRAAVAELLGRR